MPFPYPKIITRLVVGTRHCPRSVNLSLKALVSLAFSLVYNPLNPPW
jgi:hypothetical protein